MLPALEHALNVFCHDLAHVVDFFLRGAQRILLSRVRPALLDHEFLHRGVEARAAVRREARKIRVRGTERREELLLEVGQEPEWDALAELALRDDEERQPAGAGLRGGEVRGRFDKAVREMCVLVDCAVRGGCVREGGKNEGDEG
jgi:hypothetical protein